MSRRIIIYCVLAALLIFAVRMFELRFLSGMLSFKLYITLIGVIFLGLGAVVGLAFRKEKHVIQMVEVEKVPAAVAIYPNDLLTERETEVLALIVNGLSNKEIAGKLYVSENTVKKHINNLYLKLDVSRRTQAVSKAKEMGLIP